MALDDAGGAAPASRHGHVVAGAGGAQVLVASGARLFALDAAQAEALRGAELGGDDAMAAALAGLGIDPVAPPLAAPERVRAISLSVAQACNLACGYCYAEGGDFGAARARMSRETAERAIDRLIADAPPGGAVNIAFMGGEPLIARDLIRHAADYAIRRAAARAVRAGFSLTTNGTLLTEGDAAFFAERRFSVTVSMDGGAATQDAQRPDRAGRGSFARIAARLGPLVAVADKVALSARVTITPGNLDVSAAVEALGALGFPSVGVSPLLASPGGGGALGAAHFDRLLAEMIRAGDAWLTARLAGRAHPFANLATALAEIGRGRPRAVSCGAGRDYLAVEADGGYAACHRFVNAPEGRLGALGSGVDEAARAAWLGARQVDDQAPCAACWARYLCGGGCHHEVLARGRPACDYIRGWLHYAIGVYGRLSDERPDLLGGA